ncbi:hypothetical protein OEZ85_013776 [Tetradesmus obliquus]|uniref:Clusterin-associated protein 1 n=1 Tax=Tetradesmus obliquus TaxID=3088 RepID=A0ABY8U650_TETOB|nr:hypothetical protein OEZ85_013776 [Tetradesmus obliquus]
MSFKEVRSFTEMMKSLGYPRLISLDNFRSPNFELVADCLHWLIQRFYPECSMSDDISTEAERVKFLQAAAQIMLAKARMKLNLKRLYAADGTAVQELLKLAELLHRATQTAASNDEDASDAADPAAALKLLDAAAASAAAAEVEAGIQETISGLSEAVGSVTGKLQELASTESQLSARLDKRRSELERAEKRLATLAGVRPAYMDEYEALTGQLQVLWLHYLERFRNLQFLEAQLEGYRKAEQADADAAERRRRKMQRRLAEEELRILRGEAAVDESRLGGRTTAGSSDSGGSSDSEDDDAGFVNDTRRPGAGATAGMRGAAGGGRGLQQRQSFKQQQQQQQQQQGGAAGKVIGSLTAGQWDDEDDSIDDDTATDGGEVSRIGSEASAGYGAGGMEAGLGGAGARFSNGSGLDDGYDGGLGPPESEDSGF